jgi:hypothetical protein
VLVLDHAEVFPDGQVVPGTPDGALARASATGPGPLAQHPQLLALAHSACTKIIRRGFLEQTGLRIHPGWYEDSAFNPGDIYQETKLEAESVARQFGEEQGLDDMALAAIEGGLENVGINLKSLSNQQVVGDLLTKVEGIKHSLVELRRL